MYFKQPADSPGYFSLLQEKVSLARVQTSRAVMFTIHFRLTLVLTLRRLMSYIYIYGAPILDVSRSHTTTQHSR